MYRNFVDPEWSRGSVSYSLRKNLKKHFDKTGIYPDTIYASNNMGNFFPFVLCTFAIRNKLVIRFVPNDGHKPFFYFDNVSIKGGATNA